MASDRFAAVINCLDGWVHEPVSAWVKAHAGVQYVDVITAYAPERVLADGSAGEVAHIQDVVRHAMTTHDLRLLALAGHADCAGDPVGGAEQIARIQRALRVIATWGLGVPVVGLWVGADGGIVSVHEAESGPDVPTGIGQKMTGDR